MPSVQSVTFSNTNSPTAGTGATRPAAKTHYPKQRTLFSGADTLRFGKRNADADGEFTTGQKWQGGGKALLKSVSDWKWWAKEGAIACGITLATCWLPGSQLFTIPLWIGISGAFTHGRAFMEGFRNPALADAPESKAAKTAKHAADDDEEWTKGEKAKAAAKGAWKHGLKAFTLKDGDLLQNLGISALLTLATCWLPGSQLLTIPAWFCMDAAIKAGRGGYLGWQHPEIFSHQPSDDDPSEKAGKTHTK